MKHPIPLKYRRGYVGCKPQERDGRDIVLGDIPYTPDPNAPSFEEGFDNEVKYGKLKREHQGSSLSCVSQAWSKYAEMLNLIETHDKIDLSARFIYSQIFLPGGAAYIRDGAKIVVNQGVGLEKDVPSYMVNGAYPTEEFMERKDGVEEAREKAKTYQAKKFVWLDADRVNEDMRQIIWQHGGFPSGYRSHCMYCSAYGMKNGKKFIKFINSYGENSDIYIYEDDPNELYDITFLVDLPNPPNKINMKKIVGDKRDNRQYLVGDDNVLHWIFGQPNKDSAMLEQAHAAGIIDKNIIEWRDTLDGLTIGDAWSPLK
jgi:hypothetical protein